MIALLAASCLTACEKEEESFQQVSENLSIFPNGVNREVRLQATSTLDEWMIYLDTPPLLMNSLKFFLVVEPSSQNKNEVIFTRIFADSKLGKKLSERMNDTKEITIKTCDPDEFYAWQQQMLNEGRVVISYKDKETGMYIGTAYTQKEWDELNDNN